MTEEEKKAAEATAQAEAEAKLAEDIVIDPLTLKDEEIAKLREERDNYKNVALARKGKLSADDDFFKKEGIDEFIEDRVKTILADKELNKAQIEKDNELRRIVKENSELRLAIKNRPGSSIGGETGGGSVEVKDNVFSADQLRALEEKAKRLKADPQKFIEKAKLNFLNRR
jgi:hypothetical protein